MLQYLVICTGLSVQYRIVLSNLVSVRLISLGFSTDYSFTDAELSILRSNPQLGGPRTLLSVLPCLSRVHPVLRRRVLALTRPHGVGFAGSTGTCQLRHFLGFYGYTLVEGNRWLHLLDINATPKTTLPAPPPFRAWDRHWKI